LATHLDHRRSDRERLASAAAINELLNQRATTAALLAGDLNDVPESPTMVELGKQWTRANQVVAPTIPVKQPTRQIDYVLHRSTAPWRVVDTQVLDEATASDHRPIVATLELVRP
jgi:endonuclease/exonuclease/phosphatase family metal-dependent hydrolase